MGRDPRHVRGGVGQPPSRRHLGSAIGAVVILVLLSAALVWAAWLAEHHARRIGAATPASPPEHLAWAPLATSDDRAPGDQGPAKTSPLAHPAGPTDGRYEGPVRTQSPTAPYEPAWARSSPARDAERTPTAVPVPPATFRPRFSGGSPRRRHTPAGHITTAVIFGLFALGCAIASVVSLHDWRQSVATQNNGTRLQAAVVATSEVSHSTRSGTYHTTNLTVQYPSRSKGIPKESSSPPPMSLSSEWPAFSPWWPTAPIRRTVELQGIAGTSGNEVWMLLVLTLFFALFAARAARAYLRLEGRASPVR